MTWKSIFSRDFNILVWVVIVEDVIVILQDLLFRLMVGFVMMTEVLVFR